MERLTIIEHDDLHAMHPRCFDALTRGSCLERLAIWLDQRLPELEARPLRITFHPAIGESVRLAPAEEGAGWEVLVRFQGRDAFRGTYDTFAVAAQEFRARASMNGEHWSEYEPARRPGAVDPIIRAAHVVAWVNGASYRMLRYQQRQITTNVAMVSALDALRQGDPERAISALSAALADDALPLPAGLPAALLTPLRQLAMLLVAVADEDPPSYVTALETQARAVVAAAGFDLAAMEPEAEPISADDPLAA